MDQKLSNIQINKFDLLVSLYIFFIIVSELMGIKTFPLLHIGAIKLNASVAIFLFPFIYTINDAIVEVFGIERAKSVYRSGLIVIVLLILFSFLAVSLPPSIRFKKSEEAYDIIFSQSIRIALASLTAFALSDLMDIIIFHRLRKKLGSSALWFRNNLSNVISQLFDTVIFMTLAFYAFNKSFGDNVSFLTSLIIPYWLLKCFMSVIETPFVYIMVKWLRKK